LLDGTDEVIDQARQDQRAAAVRDLTTSVELLASQVAALEERLLA
jgi:outer membrane murein-binding lipoprotein Lpp